MPQRTAPVILLNVTLSDVATGCPMLIPFASTVTPVPGSALKVVPVSVIPFPAD